MKTFAQWQDSKQSLSTFYAIGDRVDEHLYDYLLEVVFPASFGRNYVQCGEPQDHGGKNGAARYSTVARVGATGSWIYLGAREKGDIAV